jgi:hypothetical protein
MLYRCREQLAMGSSLEGSSLFIAVFDGEQLAQQTITTLVAHYLAMFNLKPLKNCAGLWLISRAHRLGGHDLRARLPGDPGWCSPSHPAIRGVQKGAARSVPLVPVGPRGLTNGRWRSPRAVRRPPKSATGRHRLSLPAEALVLSPKLRLSGLPIP